MRAVKDSVTPRPFQIKVLLSLDPPVRVVTVFGVLAVTVLSRNKQLVPGKVTERVAVVTNQKADTAVLVSILVTFSLESKPLEDFQFQ